MCNLLLAVALVDKDHVDELETIVLDSVDEMSRKKAFLCPEYRKIYETEGGAFIYTNSNYGIHIPRRNKRRDCKHTHF